MDAAIYIDMYNMFVFIYVNNTLILETIILARIA